MIGRALRVLDSHSSSEEGVLEVEIEPVTSAEEVTLPLSEHPGMQLINMVTDDLLTRWEEAMHCAPIAC